VADLDKLEELAKAATAGEWLFSPWHIEEGASAVRHKDGWIVANTSSDANAAFIAAANPSAILSLLSDLAALAAENEKMREALTPSGDTKAAYHGEFKFQVTSWRENDDEEWEKYLADVTVPWTTVKEIMAAIEARAQGDTK
jgi:hypothetical protein